MSGETVTRAPCGHPIERRSRQIIGSGHYCAACGCVLINYGDGEISVEPVVIRKATYRYG